MSQHRRKASRGSEHLENRGEEAKATTGEKSRGAVKVKLNMASYGIDVVTIAEDRYDTLALMAMKKLLFYAIFNFTERMCPYLLHGNIRGGQRASR